MSLLEVIDNQLERLRYMFVESEHINSEEYERLVAPLYEALLAMTRGSVITTEDATQTGQGGEQPVATG